MTKCLCGKNIETVPTWLADVKVHFVCNNCPNRDVQGITQVDLTGGKLEEAPPKRVVGDEEEPAELEFEMEEEEETEA